MKKLINRAFIYAMLGLAAGVFYREFTKWNGFTGRTALAFMHPHLLVMGALLCLILALFTRHLPLLEDKRFGSFLRLHDIALPAMTLMLGVRGVMQVLKTDLSPGLDAAVSGLAGLTHILLGLALVFVFIALRKVVGTLSDVPQGNMAKGN